MIIIHSFRFAQGTKRNENGVFERYFLYNQVHRATGKLQITGR